MRALLILFGLMMLNGVFAESDSRRSQPSEEEIKTMFFESKVWPKNLYCVRERTIYVTDKITELDHNDLYHLDFEVYSWKDSKYKGSIEYLGSTGEFSVAFVLRDNGGYPYKVVELLNQDNGIFLTRAEVVGDSVFSYWSKCTENN